jgi:ADP-ribosylglycohydrolase
VTDDSEMTLSLLYSLNENNGKYDKETTLYQYFDWAHESKCPFLGKNTRKLLTIKTIRGYEKRYKDVFSLPESEWTQSNGSLMRCSPLFLHSDEDIITDCKLTNPHPINLECNLIYCHSLKRLHQGMDSKKVYNLALEESKLTKELFHNKLNYEENKGLAINAFQLAINSLLDDRDYQNQINDIIFKNLGGDTDTNAAITGAMLGMRFGFTKLMENKITNNNWKIVLNCDSTKGDYPRPEKYSVKNLDKLIKIYN